jgi:hypothetical protein
MKLSVLAVLLGVGFSLPNIYGLMDPKQFTAAVRRFPRSDLAGYFLMALATVWFLFNLKQETIADFEVYKKPMLMFFGALGVGTCVFVRDFLAVRGLALVLLLLAKLVVDTARWAESDWRLVLVTWAYAWIVAGIWFTVSPWRLRDLLHWSVATEHRVKLTCTLRLGFGLLVTALGLTVF